jgi:hypothetical protein
MLIASPRSRFIFGQFGKRFAIRNQVRKSLIIAVLQVPGTTWHSVSGPKARSFWLIPIHTRSAGRFGLFAHCLQMLRYENARDKRNRSGNGHFLPDHQLSCRSA